MIDPIILFFIFGLIAGLMKAELRLPSQIYDLLSVLLLVAIGLKGGIELAKQPFLELLPQMVWVSLLGLIIPLVLFPILKSVGRFSRSDSASIAAHYGSVSVGTFAVAVAWMEAHKYAYESHMSLFVVMLEIPAIIVGIILAKGISKQTQWGKISHEIFLGKGIVLLLGGLIIGWIAGENNLKPIKPLFFDLFPGVLALFLLEMGLITSRQIGSLKNYGVFIIVFGIVTPIIMAFIGILLGQFMGLSLGGSAILGTLSASASYIAVPAAMRMSVPDANPTLSLSASLGVTFPFNVLIGIPLYYEMATFIFEIL
jgi:hypothetical protein